MRPNKPKATGEGDLFRARLDQIINMRHELVQLAARIDWDWIDREVAPLYSDNGRPGFATRFVIGLLLLKHIYGLSDEGVCERWVYDPYFQHFTGEEFFQHEFPHERSDLSHWRKRLGSKLELLLAESLRVGACDRRPAHPRHQTGHGGHHGPAQGDHVPDGRQVAACGDQGAQSVSPQMRAATAPVVSAHRETRRHDGGALCPRQAVPAASSPVAPAANATRPPHPRYPPQDRRAGRSRDRIGMAARARRANPFPAAAPARVEALFLPRTRGRMHRQGQGQRALRVRRQGLGRHHQCPRPGGQFVLHAKALPGNPYDGHTLSSVIDATEKLTGCAIERDYVDKGYRGHDTANPHRVFISGQRRGVSGLIKRELRRRSAIEAVIGHMKMNGHLGRCYLKGREGDAANAILSAVGYNLRLVLAWLRILLSLSLLTLSTAFAVQLVLTRVLNGQLDNVAILRRSLPSKPSTDVPEHRSAGSFDANRRQLAETPPPPRYQQYRAALIQ